MTDELSARQLLDVLLYLDAETGRAEEQRLDVMESRLKSFFSRKIAQQEKKTNA